MKKTELVTVSMSITEALDIVRDHCAMNQVPEGYKFNKWNNNIPGDLMHDKELIKISFKKL